MNFKDFFGTNINDVKENCIICQSFDLPLFSQKSSNGFFVKTACLKNTTIIALKNNFLAGDSVLLLKKSKCKKLFLFGSCGGCGDVESGDIVMIDKAYNLESFSLMLKDFKDMDFASSNKDLMDDFYKKNPYQDLIKTNSACVGSLCLEAKHLNWYKQNQINAIDMESSIVLSASKEIGIPALCLMYVADHIEKDTDFTSLNDSLKKQMANARLNLSKMILNYINEK